MKEQRSKRGLKRKINFGKMTCLMTKHIISFHKQGHIKVSLYIFIGYWLER